MELSVARPMITPAQALQRIKETHDAAHPVFTQVVTLQEIEARSQVVQNTRTEEALALKDRVFAVKDMISTAGRPGRVCNLDAEVGGMESSIANPVVDRLEAAGAHLIGKTNMDALATGLTGTRSDIGNPLCKPDPLRVPGGSSSGSAVAVAEGLCDFALGTDTAGSGRVPAAFNGIVGFKPSKSSLSTDGVLACIPLLDCVTIFAPTAALVHQVWLNCRDDTPPSKHGKEPDPNGRQKLTTHADRSPGFTFAVPEETIIKKYCEPAFVSSFAAAVERLTHDLGATKSVLSPDIFQQFYDAGQSIYFSGLAAVRAANVERHIKDPSKLHGATHKHLEAAQNVTPKEVEEAQAKVEMMRAWVDAFWEEEAHRDLDILVFPTAPFHPTLEELQASDEVNFKRGAQLAAFCACANVLDLPAISIPSAFVGGRQDEARRPFGITFMARRHDDDFLLRLAQLYEGAENIQK